MNDREPVGLFLKRDEAALQKAQAEYGAYCVRMANNILGDPRDAEECFSDALAAAWNSIPPHIPECLQTFLGRLTRNISLKRVRSEHAQKRGAAEVRVVFEEVEEWLASGQNVEQQVSEQELAEAINDFLDSISAVERNVFVRRYWYMQSIAEIAAYHGFSESKVKSMLFRIRNKLHARLKKENYL